MDEFADRLFDLGWDRTKAVWAVPQAFGDDTYWTRKPTGKEWVVQSLLGVIHGGLGIVPWNDPTTPDIKASASALAKAMSTTLKGFILDPNATFQLITQNRVHVGVWTVSGRTLVLATNLNYNETRFSLESVHGSGSRISQVFDSGAKIQGKDVILESVGSGGFVFG
ncbi:hypothetical protein NLI96_g3193 [Meripilus lineatus]|uniref:Uncharacterized protein n=1 Tax=Meripilus lineatus TaxID=2056292 RepID=A0AAD5YL58_9APHY|nr:hypothetical protein NLI96_g3193 [Physisporinus lineatus]